MKRLTQLDGLRAFAVTGVILHHSIRWEAPIPLGPYSVRLFFVLSGFLITGILLNAKAQSNNKRQILFSFYTRRFLRIFPIYYASLLALYIAGQPDIRSTITWHCLYLSNFLCALPEVDVVPAWGHLWSLSVEEQFYLFWPAIILFVPARWLPLTIFGFIVLGPVSRLLLGVSLGTKPAVYATSSCFDSLGMGAMLAWFSFHPNWSNKCVQLGKWALIGGGCLFAIGCVNAYFDVSWMVWLFLKDLGPALIFCWLINAAADGFTGLWGKILESKLLAYIGTISYGMYLFHNFIPWIMESIGFPLPEYGLSRFFVLTPITIFAASVSWYFLEQPLNEKKKYFPYIKTEPVK